MKIVKCNKCGSDHTELIEDYGLEHIQGLIRVSVKCQSCGLKEFRGYSTEEVLQINSAMNTYLDKMDIEEQEEKLIAFESALDTVYILLEEAANKGLLENLDCCKQRILK